MDITTSVEIYPLVETLNNNFETLTNFLIVIVVLLGSLLGAFIIRSLRK